MLVKHLAQCPTPSKCSRRAHCDCFQRRPVLRKRWLWKSCETKSHFPTNWLCHFTKGFIFASDRSWRAVIWTPQQQVFQLLPAPPAPSHAGRKKKTGGTNNNSLLGLFAIYRSVLSIAYQSFIVRNHLSTVYHLQSSINQFITYLHIYLPSTYLRRTVYNYFLSFYHG